MTAAPLAAGAPRSGLARRLLALAAPVAGANILIMLMGLVDTIVVGRHSSSELAELALAWSLNGTALVATIGLLVGVQVLAARRMGEGRPEAVGAIWRRGLVIALVAGGVLGVALHFGALWALAHLGQSPELAAGAAECAAILGFSLAPNAIYMACAKTLEGINRPRAALVLMALANVLNLGLNLWLVPEMGAEGAAWATLGARLFLVAGAVGWMGIMPGAAAFRFFRLGGPKIAGEAREQLSIGLSAMGSRVLEAGAFNALTIMAGVAGSAAIAGFTIAINVVSIGFMPALGIASATAVIASNARGAGDPDTALKVARIGLIAGASYGALFAALVLIANGPIAAAFTTDPALLGQGALLIAMLAWVVIPDFTQVTAAEALRALGRPWFPTFSHLGSYVFIMAPLGWLLCVTAERGARGLVEAVAVASLVSVTALLWRLALLRRADVALASSG
jgi:MATE family multidrug resistance protein